MKRHFALTFLIAVLLNDPSLAAAQNAPPKLEKIMSFDHQVTGITVSHKGRMFVNFPRWTEDAPISVAEVTDRGVTPYPNAEWNKWRNLDAAKIDPATHFVCVQSVVVDHHNNLWVVDAAAPGNEKIVPHGAKLVKIGLDSNKVLKVIPFDDKAALQGSYLNDIRFSPDDKTAYLTDSGNGALIVVDLTKGTIRRLLEKEPSTQAEPNVVVTIDGEELRRPDNRPPVFHADGLALSSDGSMLYWQALTGKTLYGIPTNILTDKKASPQDVKAKVQKIGENGVADGLWIDELNHMYVTSPEDNSVKLRDSANKPRILVQDDGLRWPDTLSEGPDGAIYVTTSHIQDTPWFKPGADKAVPSELWKISK